MPHREVQGSVDLRSFHQSFESRTLREGRLVSRLLAAFLDRSGDALLVECMVVEGHLRQGFFLLAARREGSTMVRIHPRSAPEKTAGVKRTVSWLAACLAAGSDDRHLGTTNLEDAALADFPEDAVR